MLGLLYRRWASVDSSGALAYIAEVDKNFTDDFVMAYARVDVEGALQVARDLGTRMVTMTDGTGAESIVPIWDYAILRPVLPVLAETQPVRAF